jgi:hypothetical protein
MTKPTTSIYLQTDVDKETQDPLDKLLPVAKDWMKKNGDCNCETVQDVLSELYEKNNQKVSIVLIMVALRIFTHVLIKLYVLFLVVICHSRRHQRSKQQGTFTSPENPKVGRPSQRLFRSWG